MTEFFQARVFRHAVIPARALLIAAIAVGLMGAAPLRADLDVADSCSSTMPSCAPKYNWDCIHGEIHIVNKCDPDTAGCLIEE